jgi:HEPN domain-containing protein
LESKTLWRADFQVLAEEGLADVEALLTQQRFGAAYYLAGYVIEFALKACIARRTSQHEFPSKRAASLYTHDLGSLEVSSKLTVEFERERQADSQLNNNWLIVRSWTEESRYERRTPEAARDICKAVADQEHGVLACIRRYW